MLTRRQFFIASTGAGATFFVSAMLKTNRTDADSSQVLPYGVFLSSPPTVDRGNIVSSEYTVGQYEIADGFIPPQKGPSPHKHYSNNEAWYILKGSMAFQIDNRSVVATAGDFIFAPKGHIHAWQNLEKSEDSTRLLLIVTPPGLLQYILQLGIQGTEEYYEKFVTLAPNYDTEVLDSLFFNDSKYSVNKDNTLTATVAVRRVGKSEEPASVTIVLSDGSAKFGKEFNSTKIKVNFAPEETTQIVNVPIPIIDDHLAEGNKTINLTLENPTGGAIIAPLQDKAVLSIVDKNSPLNGENGKILSNRQKLDDFRILRSKSQLQSFWLGGGTATVVATGKDTDEQYSLFDVLVPSHTRLQPYINRLENQGFYILDGNVLFQLDDQTITLTPGSFLYLPINQPYAFGNLSMTLARIILITTPPTSVKPS